MQFKYPEILWGLFLLLIPIIIHLFQLRRFKKTPFTNVKFLKLVDSESRKSSTLKKWLLLLTRLGLLSALVFAFAQPFLANTTALRTKETVFYLDNSFSMNGQTDDGNRFDNLIQDFIQHIPSDQKFTLFTNTTAYKDVEIIDIQDELLSLTTTSQQLKIPEIVLKGNSYFSGKEGVFKQLAIISDFQSQMGNIAMDTIADLTIHYVKPDGNQIKNTSIDSVYIRKNTNDLVEVVALLSTNTDDESIAVSLLNGSRLIAKTAAKFDTSRKAEVLFTVNAQEEVLGKVAITDIGLDYDNQFYFNIDKKPKIKVLSIGTDSSNYLERIFSEDEFEFTGSTLSQLNYGSLENQNFVVLNELQEMPTSLVTSLKSFVEKGGGFVLIPAREANLESYNQLTSGFGQIRYENAVVQNVSISTINTGHPLFSNVFDKQVGDFQFPTVKEYYTIRSREPVAIEFQNKQPFLTGASNTYFLAASLSLDNSNFKNSPLIVPTFYNMGANSLSLPPLYLTIGTGTEIELPVVLRQDDVIKISNGDFEFIPQQRVLPKKVSLKFSENPTLAGIYQIENKENTLKNMSFNDPRSESDLVFSELPEEKTSSSLTDFFQERQKSNAVNEFWKWFATLALVFVLLETALQKLLK